MKVLTYLGTWLVVWDSGALLFVRCCGCSGSLASGTLASRVVLAVVVSGVIF